MMRSVAILLVLVACDAGKLAPSHHGVKRATLFVAGTDEAKRMPVHGAVGYLSTEGGSSTVILDRDAQTIRLIEHRWDNPNGDKARKLDRQQVDRVMKLANEAWHEDVTGQEPMVTDIGEDLIVFDGDWVFQASAMMLADEGQGRIAAGKTFDLLFKLAE